MDNPSKISIMLEVGLPQSNSQALDNHCPISVEDEVHHALMMIDSGHDSNVEWMMIRRLYRDLVPRRGKSKRIDNILNMIEPILHKMGYYETV